MSNAMMEYSLEVASIIVGVLSLTFITAVVCVIVLMVCYHNSRPVYKPYINPKDREFWDDVEKELCVQIRESDRRKRNKNA